jgi:hypothetical protein
LLLGYAELFLQLRPALTLGLKLCGPEAFLFPDKGLALFEFALALLRFFVALSLGLKLCSPDPLLLTNPSLTFL